MKNSLGQEKHWYIPNPSSDLVLDAGYEVRRWNKYLLKRHISGSGVIAWVERLLLTVSHSLDVVSMWTIKNLSDTTPWKGRNKSYRSRIDQLVLA